jgi:hypothetical protein
VHVKRVVEVNASQHREHQRLQESDKKFEASATRNASGAQPPMSPRPMTKPAKTLSIVCPAIMLAEEPHRVADRTAAAPNAPPRKGEIRQSLASVAVTLRGLRARPTR